MSNSALRRQQQKVEKPAEPDPQLETLEVIEVTRRWLQERGWPRSWAALLSFASGSDPEVVLMRRTRAELTPLSWRPLDIAYFRKANEDLPCLYVQAWRGDLMDTVAG